MSSGTNANVAEVGAMIRDSGGGASPGEALARQQELNRRWHFYRCKNYQERKIDWDGAPIHIENDPIPSLNYTPPGFYDAGGQMAPLSTRKPSAPYYLAKVIVNRFSGLLFGSKRHPKLVVPDDPQTEEWLNGFVESTRLWTKMIQARTYGGAMGSCAIGFVFKHGQPKIEVHDPRFCFPEFSDREEMIVERFEKRYQYADTMRDPETGAQVEGMFWYRRIVDDETDTVWPKVPVGEGEEPNWRHYRSTSVEHRLGFCPIVWIQNTEVQEDIDGDPDCHGVFDNIETMDALVAQANRGILANCDPTLVISSPDDMEASLRKGSNSAIKMTAGSANYLEISGAGPRAALEMAEKLEARVLRVARCVLDDNFGGPARTEKEVDQNYSNMLEQADVLREQYGERGVKRVLDMALTAARVLSTPRVARDGEVPRITRGVIRLPKTHDGKERILGEGEIIELDWPDWYEPGLDDTKKAVDAAGAAINFGLIDKDHAVRFIAHYFSVENVSELVEKLEAAEAAANAPVEEAYSTETTPLDDLSAIPPIEEMDYEEPMEAPSEFDGVVADVAAEEALNGAQVGALVDVLEKVYASTLPAAAAREIILGAYPTISEASVDRMLASAPAITPVTDSTPESAAATPITEDA